MPDFCHIFYRAIINYDQKLWERFDQLEETIILNLLINLLAVFDKHPIFFYLAGKYIKFNSLLQQVKKALLMLLTTNQLIKVFTNIFSRL